MNKKLTLLLALALVLALFTSCSLIVKDPEVDKQTVVLEVDGRQFTKGELQPVIQQELEYQEYLYQYQYGMTLDLNDPELISYARDMAIETMTQEAILEKKLTEGGYLDFSEDELAQAEAYATEMYDSYVNGVMASEFPDAELTDEAKRAEAEAIMLASSGYPTREQLVEEQKASMASEKLYSDIVGDVTVSEEEVRAEYDSHVAAAQADYEAEPSYFDMDVNDGATIYYYPAGYRYVKHILLAWPEETTAQLEELDSQILFKQQELSNTQSALATLPADPAQDNESEALSRQELMAEHDRVEGELEALLLQRDEVEAAAAAALQPTVDEIRAAVEAGEDFDQLIALYGEDPGMTSEPAMSRGYLVGYSSTNWVESFRDGAMALENVGDVSEPVRSEYGLHIIRYMEEIPEGPVAYEDVKATLENEALENKRSEAYQSVMTTWINDADVKVYRNRLDD